MIAAVFGLGGVEIFVLLVSWLFLVGFMVAVVFLAYQTWRRDRGPDATTALVEEVRRLREEVTDLKKGRP